MFFLWRKDSKARRVEDGRSIVHPCEGCERDQAFYEVEILSTYSALTIEYDKARERAFACVVCGMMIPEEELETPPPERQERELAPEVDARALAEAEGKRKRERDRAQRERAEAKARSVREIEGELEALKRKLRR